MTPSPLPSNRSAVLGVLVETCTIFDLIVRIDDLPADADQAEVLELWGDIAAAVRLARPDVIRAKELFEKAAQAPVPHRPGVTGQMNPVQPIPEPVAANDAHDTTPTQPGPVVA